MPPVCYVDDMAAACGLTIIKRFTYRGSAEDWSNNYWFTGGVPADATAWRALFDAVVLQEKTVYPSVVTVVHGYGYDNDADDREAVWSVDLTVSPNTPVAGTLTLSSTDIAPGDSAVWARWKTSRTANGKSIYLRKYFHPAGMADSPRDAIRPGQSTALVAYAAKMYDASLPGGRKITARGHTDVITAHGVSAYITTRTLKRRGKRNPTS